MASQALHFLNPTYSAPNRSLSRVSSPSKPLLLAQSPRLVRPISAISSDIDSSSSSPSVLISGNGKGGIFGGDGTAAAAAVADVSGIEVDAVTEAELKENGFRSTRRTKLVCTIGPATCGFEQLEALAVGGMNVARINMCHGTRDWHRRVIERVRRLNEEKGYAVAIMMDTEGSEIHMGDLGGAASAARAEDGEIWTFSVRAFDSPLPEQTINVNYEGFAEGPHIYIFVRAFDSPLPEQTINVNYEGFAEDVKVGDDLLVDGGMVRFEVIEKIGPDVKCRCTDPGLLLPRANLTFWRDGSLVRERNAMLPTISSKDWLDIDFGISEGVDFIAISFVKSAEVIRHLKSYIAARSRDSDIAVIAKIESVDSLKNLEEIIRASDGAMVARGDLGAQIPLEQVPSAQQKIVQLCRQLDRPVIVASQLLESMIEYPTPTRAEVADISEAVRQRADALMLSGESAMGQYPEKALTVLRSVSLRIEKWWREEKRQEAMVLPEISSSFADSISEEICNSAAKMVKGMKMEVQKIHSLEKTLDVLAQDLAKVQLMISVEVESNFCNFSIASEFRFAYLKSDKLRLNFGKVTMGLGTTLYGLRLCSTHVLECLRSSWLVSSIVIEAHLADNLEVDAIFVYTKTGQMASLLSRCRPDCPIFAFTTTTSVRRRLNLQWGLIPFRLNFSDDMESNLNRTFSLLKARGMIQSGDLVIAVSDMLQSIQVMNVP
ncbi:hypothetical protein Scep_009838 [Stephania cephalantha]|uniref:pyruvate kinase n=1 Tax=Stephania cephalantha TaxID=152367 RepID=A0AAP0JTZ4_9MAGN